MELYLDPGATRGATRSLLEQLREAIVSGRLAAGDRLPPSRELAEELGVSRHTVTTVYGLLVAEGYLTGRSGGGTFVSTAARTLRRAGRRPPSVLRPVPVERVTHGSPPPTRGGVDLRLGQSDPALFPVQSWRRCTASGLHRPLPGYSDPAGVEELRAELAAWVGRSRGVDVDAGQIVVTSGAQQAIHLIARSMLGPGDAIAVEEPGYPPVRALFTAIGLRVVPVPVDGEGLLVDELPVDVRVVYTTPSHQSPTGATMSLDRRRQLLEFAERNDAAIIEDDYDSEFRHTDRPLDPLHRLDRSGRVAYVGTFSKSLAPSLRLGFAALPDALVETAVEWRRLIDVQPPSTSQFALHDFITGGHLERHLRRVRKVHRSRHGLVRDFVGSAVADGLLLAGPDNHAGLHVSALLPSGVDERLILDGARRRDLALSSFDECCALPATPRGLLIGFGMASESDLRRGLPLLRELLASAAR